MKIIEILKSFLATIIQWGAVALSAILIYFKIRQSGKDAQENINITETLEGVKVRDKIEDRVNSASDAELDRMYNEEIKRD